MLRQKAGRCRKGTVSSVALFPLQSMEEEEAKRTAGGFRVGRNRGEGKRDTRWKMPEMSIQRG